MLISLDDPRASNAAVAGSKAARLATARQAGLPVPAGFVVPVDDDPDDESLVVAAAGLAPRVAVRSSGVAEDLAGASFAGVYKSVLDVRPADVPAAVARCRGSARSARAQGYRSVAGGSSGMAVLVQAMVPAAAAGVAFTADPLTGDREAVLVTAVPGLAEPLVSGEAEGEQWRIVAGQRPQPHRPTGVLNGEQAAAVAAVARRLEALFTGPQDVEWALADGTVWVVQARPMTALPAPVAWPAPGSGLWACNFRLGEWLPEPVTPLFADWLLPLFDAGFQAGMRETAGAAVPFPFGLVNGWYYATPNPRLSAIPLAVARSRGRLLRFMLTSVVLPGRRPTWAAASLLRLYRDWQEQLLPDYQRLAATEVDDLDLPGVLALVERVVGTAGQHFWYLVVIGGAAWKVEDALRAFLVRHHLTDIDAAALVGPVTIPGPRAPQAVYSLDWYHPTASEQPTSEPPSAASPRNAQSDVDARALQARCAARLASDPAVQWTEVDLLELARAFARIREEQSAALTLGWPLLRRCARRIGILLAQSGQLQRPEQMFFLTRAELGRATAAGALDDRRQTWSTQRRLTPPLSIGNPPPLLGRRLRQTVGTTDTRPTEGDELVGQPASPGRATGPARIVRDPDDFGKVQPGDVLVAPATAPAWTPLFGRVLAVVTDRGTAAAHASILAREYGIPAVVATQDATRRLSDGTMITVDGYRGRVTITGG